MSSSAVAATTLPAGPRIHSAGFTQGYGYTPERWYHGGLGATARWNPGLGQPVVPATPGMPDVSDVGTGPLIMATAGGAAGAALYGGIIGGLASADWRGAGTGAIAGAGITGVGYGAVLLMNNLWLTGGLIGALGVGGVVWAGMRWNKKRKRR